MKNDSPPMPKSPAQHPRNAAQTKERILKAARELFSHGTYESVGTRDIAAQAGVNATLINRYFGSKKKLFAEVVEDMGNPNAPYRVGQSSKDMMDQAVKGILEDGMESPLMVELRIILLSALNPQVSDIIANWFEKRRQRLIENLPGESPASRADLIFSFPMGLAIILKLLRNNSSHPIDTGFIKKYLDNILGELFGQQESDLPAKGTGKQR